MIRASGTVDGIGAKELSQALWDIESRREWDKANISEWRVVRALDKDTDVHYMRCKGMFGMAERDFADMRRRYELPDQEAYAIVFIAVDVPEVPEEPPAVRAETLFAGQACGIIAWHQLGCANSLGWAWQVIRPTGPQSCKVTILNQTDIKGSIPPYLVNKACRFPPSLLLPGQ